jgi:hypothetical protein
VPCVLAGDEIGISQGFDGPWRDVAEIADRRGDEMQAGNETMRGLRSLERIILGGLDRRCSERFLLRQ